MSIWTRLLLEEKEINLIEKFSNNRYMLNLSDIAPTANYYSPLITAIATVVLSILTWKYIKEIRKERRFRLMLDHTNDLKKRVIEPLIKELERIRIPESFPYRPHKSGAAPVIGRGPDSKYSYYRGEELEVEKREDILFKSLKKHEPSLFKEYDDFKRKCKELCERYDLLKSKVEEWLKKKGIQVEPWEEIYSECKSDVFEREHMLSFFLDSVLAEARGKVEFAGSEDRQDKRGNRLIGQIFKYHFEEQYNGRFDSEIGIYFFRKPLDDNTKPLDDNTKKRKKRMKDNLERPVHRVGWKELEPDEELIEYLERDPMDIYPNLKKVKDSLERLIEEAKNEFKEDISCIHNLIKNCKQSKSEILKDLKKLKEKKILEGKCELCSIKKI